MKKRNKAAIRLAAKQARDLRNALAASFSPATVAANFVTATPEPVSTQEARDWAKSNVVLKSAGVATALTAIYANAWLFGKDAGRQAQAESAIAAGAPMKPEYRAALSIGWNNWTPGNRAAALLADPPKGFSKVLADRDVTLKGISQTTTDRIGTLLADGLNRGLPAKDIAANLTELGLSNSRALTIANTETNNVLQEAQIATYEQAGVTQVEWSTVVPCDVCAENDGEIRDIGDEFPSGDTQPTVHPNCYCDVIPVVDLLDGADKSISPDIEGLLTLDTPTAEDIEQALTRLSILPNLVTEEAKDTYLQNPWTVVDQPTIAPHAYDKASVAFIDIADLNATNRFISRKKVERQIRAAGVAPKRSYPLVAVIDGQAIIIDGHNRLLSKWLLGLDHAPVWLIKE